MNIYKGNYKTRSTKMPDFIKCLIGNYCSRLLRGFSLNCVYHQQPGYTNSTIKESAGVGD